MTGALGAIGKTGRTDGAEEMVRTLRVRGRLPSATAATGANRGYGEGSRGSGEDCWLVGSGDGLENGARQQDRVVAITAARFW